MELHRSILETLPEFRNESFSVRCGSGLGWPPVVGVYFIDDLLPQPNRPDGHDPKVPTLIETLERRPGFATVKLAWASGLMLVVRQP